MGGDAARGVRRVPGPDGRRCGPVGSSGSPPCCATWRRGDSSLKLPPPRFLVAKPGLDGHSNGAEQIAVAARDAGMEVIYQGIRLSPEQIAAVARDEEFLM